MLFPTKKKNAKSAIVIWPRFRPNVIHGLCVQDCNTYLGLFYGPLV